MICVKTVFFPIKVSVSCIAAVDLINSMYNNNIFIYNNALREHSAEDIITNRYITHFRETIYPLSSIHYHS